MLQFKNFFSGDNFLEIESKGNIKVFEYIKDLSTDPDNAMSAYFSSKMNIRKRQVVIKLENDEYVLSAGAMQLIAGAISVSTDVKGVGDFLGKALGSRVTKESAIKPKYSGSGILVLEPTYKHILVEDVSQWGSLVLEDGLFLACEATVKQKVVARSNLSSAILGNEGLFNLSLSGNGLAVLESPVPREELMTIELNDDVLKIDGSFAIAWSNSLEFTVEKTTKSFVGSAISGEGFVNVYKGTGRVLLAPIK